MGDRAPPRALAATRSSPVEGATDEIEPAWKRWSLDEPAVRPMLERVAARRRARRDQGAVRTSSSASARWPATVERVICATDAGREGELIFRYIYEAAGSGSRCSGCGSRRSPTTPSATASRACATARLRRPRRRRAGPQPRRLAGGHEPLARLRAVARRASSRSAACRRRRWRCWSSASSPFATSCPRTTSRWSPASRARGRDRTYDGVWFRATGGRAPAPPARRRRRGRRPSSRARRPATAPSSRSKRRDRSALPPPLLYDLTELQRHANRLYGMSAQRTLELAQALYEQHKLISYPRTDSRHLSDRGRAHAAGSWSRRSRRRYAAAALAPAPASRPLSQRFVDDAKVSDHHAIIPTATSRGRRSLSPTKRAHLRADLPPAALRRGTTITSGPRPRGDHRRVAPERRRPLREPRHRHRAGRLEGARRRRGNKRARARRGPRRPTAATPVRPAGAAAPAGARRGGVKKRRRPPRRASPTRRCSPRWKAPASRSTRKSCRPR